MPNHRNFQLHIDRILAAPISVRLRKGPPRKPRKGKGGEFVPVEPDRPKGLEGGAAAALEYDD